MQKILFVTSILFLTNSLFANSFDHHLSCSDGTTQNTYQISKIYNGVGVVETETLELNGKVVLKRSNSKVSNPNITIEWKELDLNLLGTRRQKLGNYMKSTLNTIKVLTVKDTKNNQGLFKGHLICNSVTEFRGNITP